MVSSIGDFASPDLVKTASGYYHLPRTILNVKVTPPASNAAATIQVTSAAESDAEAAVLFNIEHSPLADDTIELKIDSTGLLNSVSSTSQDRTGDIAVNVAKLVFSTLTDGADTSAFNARSLPTTTSSPGLAASYDPFDVRQAWAVRQALTRANFCILVGDEARSANIESACRRPPARQPTDLVAASYAGRNPGIYYRRPTPVPIQIYQRDPSSTDPQKNRFQLIWAGNELFFDKSALYRVDVDRAAFVTKSVTINFTSGALSDIKVINPSEIYAASTVAVQIAQIILAIPLSGLQQQKSLTDAQTNLLNSQANLITAQRSLLTLQTQQSSDGRSLIITPNYSAPRALQTPAASVGLGDVDQCMASTQMTREQCIAAINSDANR